MVANPRNSIDEHQCQCWRGLRVEPLHLLVHNRFALASAQALKLIGLRPMMRSTVSNIGESFPKRMSRKDCTTAAAKFSGMPFFTMANTAASSGMSTHSRSLWSTSERMLTCSRTLVGSRRHQLGRDTAKSRSRPSLVPDEQNTSRGESRRIRSWTCSGSSCVTGS